MDFLAITDDCTVPNVQGSLPVIYAVCHKKVDVFPPFGTIGSGGSITLTGDITLTATNTFKKMDMFVQTGELKHNPIGPNGSAGVQSVAEIEFRNTGATATEAAIALINSQGVFVLPQVDGTKRVIGTKDSPAIVEYLGGTEGKDGTQEKAHKFAVKTSNHQIAPYYTGTIDLTA